MPIKNVFSHALATFSCVALLQCVSSVAMANNVSDEYDIYTATYDDTEISDPFESANRVIFRFNDTVDNYVLEPLAKGYRASVHETYRGMIGNIFRNFQQPSSALNHLLQGDPENAGHALWSFMIDSAVGGGALAITEKAGTMPDHQENFTQTLAVWGVPTGPYLVLPFIGPSTVRGLVGTVVDRAAVPDYILLHGQDVAMVSQNVANVVHTRYELLPVTEAIEENAAFDMYASYKSAYSQNMKKNISQ